MIMRITTEDMIMRITTENTKKFLINRLHRVMY